MARYNQLSNKCVEIEKDRLRVITKHCRQKTRNVHNSRQWRVTVSKQSGATYYSNKNSQTYRKIQLTESDMATMVGLLINEIKWQYNRVKLWNNDNWQNLFTKYVIGNHSQNSKVQISHTTFHITNFSKLLGRASDTECLVFSAHFVPIVEPLKITGSSAVLTMCETTSAAASCW